MVVNIVEKGEIVGYWNFFNFPLCFQQDFPRVAKTPNCVSNVKLTLYGPFLDSRL